MQTASTLPSLCFISYPQAFLLSQCLSTIDNVICFIKKALYTIHTLFFTDKLTLGVVAATRPYKPHLPIQNLHNIWIAATNHPLFFMPLHFLCLCIRKGLSRSFFTFVLTLLIATPSWFFLDKANHIKKKPCAFGSRIKAILPFSEEQQTLQKT